MGYQESWLYIEPQHKFKKLIQAYEKAEQSGYYEVAGAELVTTFALACELQADWKRPSANDMLAPFIQNLPEYGFVLQNFWNNANQHTVTDPFGMVK